MAFLATVNAFYITPNPWTVATPTTTQPLAANITQSPKLLFRRQELPGAGDSPTTIYANGEFLEPRFASLFNCAPSSTSSEPPPPPPPPSPTPDDDDDNPPGAQPECNTADHLNGIELERDAKISSFDKDDMADLFEDQCGRNNQHYPINEHKDIEYVDDEPKVRLVMDARAQDGRPDPLDFDDDACVEDFHRILDNCEFCLFSSPFFFGVPSFSFSVLSPALLLAVG
ncbi:MAG: hypothetical protein Q9216_004066 [Gyalolechia sp. 2 TL-2023]